MNVADNKRMLSLTHWVPLFRFSFCICGVKNIDRCLVIHQAAFYIVGPTKKLSLKCNFCEAIFHVFLTEFHKNLFVFMFQKHFFQNLIFFYFFLYFKLIYFFIFSYYFDALISKIIFTK